MAKPGAANFAQPEMMGSSPIIVRSGGLENQIECMPEGVGVEPARQANILNMGDGSDVIQYINPGVDAPLDAGVHRWRWTRRLSNEDDWKLLQIVQACAEPFYFIPFKTEAEAWVMAAGSNAKNVSRREAEVVSSTFDSVSYAPRAFLISGATQTELTRVTGVPTALTEYRLADTLIEVEGVAQDDKLVLVYYPAYPVVLPRLPMRMNTFNSVNATIEMTEVRGNLLP